MRDFPDEYSLLKQSGISYNAHVLPVSINFFCCDAPARAFLKKIKNHTGYDSSERCVVHGEYEGGVVFHESACTLRNDIDFSMGLYPEYQLGRSNLLDFEISCVKMFVLDPMHLVYLGVVRRMTSFWIEGPRICCMSFQQLNRISLNLLNLNGKLPSEFARQPRSLDVFKRWEATEWRQFLPYKGTVVLKSVLNPTLYEHFLSLTVAISILSCNGLSLKMISYSREINTSIKLYGPSFQIYNVHSLIHLPDDTSYFKDNLDNISAFRFENHLKTLKSMIRNSNSPLAQMVKRVSEKETAGGMKYKKIETKAPVKEKDNWFALKGRKHIVHIVKSTPDNANIFEC